MSGAAAARESFAAGFQGSGAADSYERILVPRFFLPCAVTLLARVGVHPGETLVDVATGTGIVARLAAAAVGTRGRVVGVDRSEKMLARARAVPLPPDAAAIEWHEATADALPLPDEIADAVTCQQGLQFMPDAAAAIAEMRRVLRPGGRMGIALWRPIAECVFWDAVHEAALVTVDRETADLILAPYSWPGAGLLTTLLREAGLTDVAVETHGVLLELEGGVRQGVASLRATPMAPYLEELRPDAYESFLHEVTARLRLASPDEPGAFPARTWIATARR